MRYDCVTRPILSGMDWTCCSERGILHHDELSTRMPDVASTVPYSRIHDPLYLSTRPLSLNFGWGAPRATELWSGRPQDIQLREEEAHTKKSDFNGAGSSIIPMI